jgi:hypothetical protein
MNLDDVPLPEPFGELPYQRPSGHWGRLEGFTAGQLRADRRAIAAMVAKECAKICRDRYMGDNNREDMEARRCEQAILAHFGVKP